MMQKTQNQGAVPMRSYTAYEVIEKNSIFAKMQPQPHHDGVMVIVNK